MFSISENKLFLRVQIEGFLHGVCQQIRDLDGSSWGHEELRACKAKATADARQYENNVPHSQICSDCCQDDEFSDSDICGQNRLGRSLCFDKWTRGKCQRKIKKCKRNKKVRLNCSKTCGLCKQNGLTRSQLAETDFGKLYLSLLIKHESCLSVCGFVCYLFSEATRKESQHHDILALGIIGARFGHDEAHFFMFCFFNKGCRVSFENISHFNS